MSKHGRAASKASVTLRSTYVPTCPQTARIFHRICGMKRCTQERRPHQNGSGNMACADCCQNRLEGGGWPLMRCRRGAGTIRCGALRNATLVAVAHNQVVAGPWLAQFGLAGMHLARTIHTASMEGGRSLQGRSRLRRVLPSARGPRERPQIPKRVREEEEEYTKQQ